jgi:hypothetical protein
MYLKFRNILIPTLIFVFFACGKNNQPDTDPNYILVNNEAPIKNPDWLKEDSTAYGLVVFVADDIPQMGKPVKCKILNISVRGVKCQALEKVSLFDKFNCYKIGIDSGQIWYEIPADLFKTKDEALAFLKLKNIYDYNFN